MSGTVHALVAEVTHSRQLLAERDDALRREIERADLLQRMLGADKAIGVLARAAWGSALVALRQWWYATTAIDDVNGEVAELFGRLRAADDLTAETAARLEAEEARRSEAERLAFDEGRRRRHAEEVRATAEAQIQQARADAEAQLHQALAAADEELQQSSAQSAARLDAAHSALVERFSVALAARLAQYETARLLGVWRVSAQRARHTASRRHDESEPRCSTSNLPWPCTRLPLSFHDLPWPCTQLPLTFLGRPWPSLAFHAASADLPRPIHRR